jgi:hypothetical protein
MKHILLKLVIGLAILAAWPLPACDVNLFAIISGIDRHDDFTGDINSLAAAVKSLGDSYQDSRSAETRLQQLMQQWVRVSGKFSQFPPDWGKNDPQWQKKFATLGSIIGEIRRWLGKNNELAHSRMLKFSRLLPQLYEFMPMSEQAKVLLKITANFDRIWDAYFDRNQDIMHAQTLELQKLCGQLNESIMSEVRPELPNLTRQVEQLRISTGQINAFKTRTLPLILAAAEGEFVALNARLSQKNDSPE